MPEAKPSFDPQAPRLTFIVHHNGKDYAHHLDGDDLKAQTTQLIAAYQENFKNGVSFYTGEETVSYPAGAIVRMPRSFVTLDPALTDPDGNWQPKKVLTGPEVHRQSPRGDNVQLDPVRMATPPETRAITEGYKPSMGKAPPVDYASPNNVPLPPEVADRLMPKEAAPS